MTVAKSDAFEGERLARLLLGTLEADLPDALDDVAGRWVAEAALALPDPVTYHLGFNPTLLELESTSFPIVAVIPGETVPEGPTGGWGFQKEAQVVDIHFFVAADDLDTVGILSWRYAEAIRSVLQGNRVIGGYEQADYRPEFEPGLAGRHPKYRLAEMADSLSEADVDYVQGGRITITLRGG